ncbi:MAG: hypothetical protein GWP15_02005 [Nitrospirae bacterium]|nr:hypothetical protein [Nitrospirota bacterium]
MGTPEDPDNQSHRAETPVVSTPFSGPAAQTDPGYKPNLKTPVIMGLGAEIDAILSKDLPTAEDPATTETPPTANEIIEELLVLSNLSQQQIYDSLNEEMDKIDPNDAQELWVTAIQYMNEIVGSAFGNLKKIIERKADEINEQQLLSNLQFCWQKILSKEGKILVIEEMRALINSTDDDDLKKRLFWGFVLSIINATTSQDDEEPCIGISNKMRTKLQKAKAPQGEDSKPFPQKISLEILLPSNKTYTEIHNFLSSKKSITTGNEHIIAEVMLEILEQDFFTDEQWEKITRSGNQTEYIRMCNELSKEAKAQILERANGEKITPSPEMLTAYVRAWNKIIYPRLLAWGEILYSTKLLLPKVELHS